MAPSSLLQANRRVQSAQRIYSTALARLRPGDSASLSRLSKASYVLGLARERFVQLAKRRSHLSSLSNGAKAPLCASKESVDADAALASACVTSSQ